MNFESARWPGRIHLGGAVLDAPATAVPQLHCNRTEHLASPQLDHTSPSVDADEHADPEQPAP